MRNVILLDNGSLRAQSTLSLRGLAAALTARTGERIDPVSLLHADRIPAELLGDRPADTFEPFLRHRAAAGGRDFLVLPLFFGASRALTEFIPEKVAEVTAEIGAINLRMAPALYPLPAGEPRLVDVLIDNLMQTANERKMDLRRVVLVDHGSPIPAVTEVRRDLAAHMREALGTGVQLEEAVMERRPGAAYDFNGDLLEVVVRRIARNDPNQEVILSMLFLSAGRHAGPGGDVEQICQAVRRDFPSFRVHPTRLVGSHPGVVDILESRYKQSAQRP